MLEFIKNCKKWFLKTFKRKNNETVDLIDVANKVYVTEEVDPEETHIYESEEQYNKRKRLEDPKSYYWFKKMMTRWELNKEKQKKLIEERNSPREIPFITNYDPNVLHCNGFIHPTPTIKELTEMGMDVPKVLSVPDGRKIRFAEGKIVHCSVEAIEDIFVHQMRTQLSSLPDITDQELEEWIDTYYYLEYGFDWQGANERVKVYFDGPAYEGWEYEDGKDGVYGWE